ncbi:sugar phosphate nucleotidyltransferase [Patescibacteria group bacterium]
MSKLKDYQAIIPLGGDGKRLKPFTKDRSKAVVPLFNNFPITEVGIFNIAKKLGIREFILGVNGYQNYLDIQLYYQGGFGWSNKMGIKPQVHFHYQNPNYNDKGSADSVFYNIRKFDITKPVIVFQNDIIFSPADLYSLVRFSEENNFDFVIGLTQLEKPEEYGLAKLSSNKKTIEKFIEKPENILAKNVLINTGVYVIKPQAFKDLQEDFGKDVLPKLVKTRKLGGYIFKDTWLDFGSAKAHHRSFQNILNQNFSYLLPFLKRTAKNVPNTDIWIRGLGPQSLKLNENIKTSIENRKITTKGKVIIGNDCMIGDNTFIKSSSIGDMTVIKSGTKIIESNIMDAWQIGENVKIEKSTLGRGGAISNYTRVKLSFLGDNVVIGSEKTIDNKVLTKHSRVV